MQTSIKKLTFAVAAASLFAAACKQKEKGSTTTIITDSTVITKTSTPYPPIPLASAFEKTIYNKQTHLYVLKNKNGMEAAITNYGGRLVSLLVHGKAGKMTDVVLGFENVDGFINSKEPYYGATIGRFGNRIAKGKFKLEGKAYTLVTNNGPNTLHGGKPGFEDVVWDANQIDSSTLELTYLARDMEGGFPGNLNVKVTYKITDDNAMKVSYEATTDKTTVVNLTNHAFFNLNGEGSGTILGHLMQIDAAHYTPVDSTLIPTGKIEAVAGTPFDFTKPETIGSRIENNDQQLKNGKGYDHNFVLSKHDISTPIATVTGDVSGIQMQVYTREPGLQFYSGNFMKSKNVMKRTKKDDYRTAFAMETQHFPDSPNQSGFPTTVLKPGQVYKTETIYKFSLK